MSCVCVCVCVCVSVSTTLPCLAAADMIAENALEEVTKNMDPNLVIVEIKEGVQLK